MYKKFCNFFTQELQTKAKVSPKHLLIRMTKTKMIKAKVGKDILELLHHY